MLRSVGRIQNVNASSLFFSHVHVQICFVDLPPQDPKIVLQGCSVEARDLTWQLLQLDPEKRPSAPEALRHM